MPLLNEKIYTIEDIYNLPEGHRAELIDGELYDMAPPSTIHQQIVGELFYTIQHYIKKHQGSCKPMISPFAVFLNADDQNYVEPDICVICDSDSLTDKGFYGAPDWVIEVVSPSTQRIDYGIKLFKYRTAGVREYWIVNPASKTVNVYDFEKEESTAQYTFSDTIPVCLYPDFTISIETLLLS